MNSQADQRKEVRGKSKSLFRLGMQRFRRSRSAMLGLTVLIILYITAVFADFMAPYHYGDEVRRNSYSHPNVRFRDAEGKFHWRPFVYKQGFGYEWVEEDGIRIREKVWYADKTERYPLRLFPEVEEYKLLRIIPMSRRLFGVGEPVPDSGEEAPRSARMQPGPPHVYLMGANDMGQDVFSRILYGGRVSLTVGLVGSFITFTLGMIVGGVSGYFGGIVDNIAQRICEMIMMIPGFYLMLALRMSMPAHLSSTQVYFFVIAILSFIGWAGFARVIRGLVLSIRSKEYVLAARAAGVRNARIIARHVLPNTLSYAIISITLGVPGYILGESALSLLGLGIQRPHASWGNMLSEAMSISQIQFHPWILIPGVFIFVTVMSFNLVGDGLRDAFDPQGLTKRAEKR